MALFGKRFVSTATTVSESRKSMKTLIHERVELARAGTNSTVICRMSSGWAVLGDAQFFSGYSLLLPDPVVPDLNALGPDERRQYLCDPSTLTHASSERQGHLMLSETAN